MAWKSITFNKASADGRFTPNGAKANSTVVPSPEGQKTPKGSKTEGWLVKGDSSTGGTKKTSAGEAKSASTQAVAKHRDAMTGVILDAKKLAGERRTKLDSIKDPDLKRSATR